MTAHDADTNTNAPWYQNGLAFTCTRCGACCTGAPGYVWLDPEQIARLAEFRGELLESFSRKYVRRVHNRYSLVERPNGDCVFWDRDQGCTVYPARPEQCRTWPFWPENLESPADWEQVTHACPGAGQGAIIPVEAIEEAARRTPRS